MRKCEVQIMTCPMFQQRLNAKNPGNSKPPQKLICKSSSRKAREVQNTVAKKELKNNHTKHFLFEKISFSSTI